MIVKTSRDSPLRVDWLDAEAAGGRLGLTLAPGKHARSVEFDGRWARSLSADLDQLAQRHGADTLVCLLEDAELKRLGLGAYLTETAARGLEVHRLPIVDGSVPEDRSALAATLDVIAAALAADRAVVVHCAGGLGRSGVVAGCHLRRRGVPGEEALRLLRAARGPRCPENETQREFIRRWPPLPLE